MRIGILAFQGGVIEHYNATKEAAQTLGVTVEVRLVRRKMELVGLDALIIPGGESTVLSKLINREDCWEEIKAIKNIFGTCAGAILLAKKINGRVTGQKTLELMDIEADRNAYGAQTESFEVNVEIEMGFIPGTFIRAPKLKKMNWNVNEVARVNGEVVGFEQKNNEDYYLALAFHPELKTIKMHEYFLKKLLERSSK